MDYLDIIRQVEQAYQATDQHKESMVDQTPPCGAVALAPGCLISWEGSDGKPRGPATVDFFHTDADGTVWAFYTLPDGTWGAVNRTYVLKIELPLGL